MQNLDAFNDVLRGGFGTPEDGFVLVWKNHEKSRRDLGHFETARRLERLLSSCHPSNRDCVRKDLEVARRGEGPTLFDAIVEIIRDHGEGGEQAEDAVELILEWLRRKCSVA